MVFMRFIYYHHYPNFNNIVGIHFHFILFSMPEILGLNCEFVAYGEFLFEIS